MCAPSVESNSDNAMLLHMTNMHYMTTWVARDYINAWAVDDTDSDVDTLQQIPEGTSWL